MAAQGALSRSGVVLIVRFRRYCKSVKTILGQGASRWQVFFSVAHSSVQRGFLLQDTLHWNTVAQKLEEEQAERLAAMRELHGKVEVDG